MATAPVVIGPFDNVPAPGSPIKSDWAQEISQYVNTLPNSLVALVAVATDTGLVGVTPTDVPGSNISWPARAGRVYLLVAVSGTMLQGGQGGHVGFQITNAAGAVLRGATNTQAVDTYATRTALGYVAPAAGTQTAKLQISTTSGSVMMYAGAQLMAFDMGRYPIVQPGT